MNIIEEQRKQIIDTNNTGQERLKAIIENMNKENDELYVSEPLNGDLDLEILKPFKIKSLKFNAGNITSLKNIPPGLKILEIPENLLVKVENLPSSLVELNIDHNYIDDLEFDDLPKALTHINISHNYFDTIDKLPPNLEELNCSNNRLTYINLQGLKKLHTLNISHNMITIIDNYPETIVKFINENNPSIQYRESETLPKEQKIDKDNMDVHSALKKYFELKSNYEKEILKKKRDIFKIYKNKKERMLRIHNLKPRCISCKRNVGTVFEKIGSVYKASCNDATDPCKLNIEINAGYHLNVINQIGNLKTSMSDAKDQMMKYKMDSLFDYMSDDAITKLYEKLNEEFEINRYTFKELTDLYNESYFNEKTEAIIENTNNDLFEYNEELQNYLKKFEVDKSRESLTEAMRIYINQVLPLHQKIYNLKYKVIELIEENNKMDLEAKTRLHTDTATLSEKTLDVEENTAVKYFEV